MTDLDLEDRALEALTLLLLNRAHNDGKSMSLEQARAEAISGREMLRRQRAWRPEAQVRSLDTLRAELHEMAKRAIGSELRRRREAACAKAGVGEASRMVEAARAHARKTRTAVSDSVLGKADSREVTALKKEAAARAEAAANDAALAEIEARQKARALDEEAFTRADPDRSDIAAEAARRVRAERPWLFGDATGGTSTSTRSAPSTPAESQRSSERRGPVADRTSARLESGPRATVRAIMGEVRHTARSIVRTMPTTPHRLRGDARKQAITNTATALREAARAAERDIPERRILTVSRAMVLTRSADVRRLLCSLLLSKTAMRERARAMMSGEDKATKVAAVVKGWPDEKWDAFAQQLVATVRESLELTEDVDAEDAIELLGLLAPAMGDESLRRPEAGDGASAGAGEERSRSHDRSDAPPKAGGDRLTAQRAAVDAAEKQLRAEMVAKGRRIPDNIRNAAMSRAIMTNPQLFSRGDA